MARDVLWVPAMANQTCRRNRTALGLAVLIVALVAGSRAARADEANASEEPQTQQTPTQPTQAAEEPEASVDSQAAEQPQTFEQPHTRGREASERPRSSWYGWQTVVSDIGAIGLWTVAYVVDETGSGTTSWQSYDIAANVLAWSGVAVYAMGAPLIHLAHGNGRKALGSLGLRAGLPLGGAIVGVLIGSLACGDANDSFISCPVALGAMGFAVGGIAAPIVDSTVLARETVTLPTSPRFQAAFVPSASGGTFVLGGRF